MPVHGNPQELLALAVDDRIPVDQIPDLGTCRPEDLLALVAKVFPDVGTASCGTQDPVACWQGRLRFLNWLGHEESMVTNWLLATASFGASPADQLPSAAPPAAAGAPPTAVDGWAGGRDGAMTVEEVRQWLAGLGLDKYADALLHAGWDCLEVRRPRRSLQAPRVMGAPPARGGRRRADARPRRRSTRARPCIRRAWRCVAATATALTIQAAAAAAAAPPHPSRRRRRRPSAVTFS